MCLVAFFPLSAGDNNAFRMKSAAEMSASFKLAPYVCPLVSLPVHPSKKNRQTCVRKSLICAFAMAFIISVMLIAANQMLRNGME